MEFHPHKVIVTTVIEATCLDDAMRVVEQQVKGVLPRSGACLRVKPERIEIVAQEVTK